MPIGWFILMTATDSNALLSHTVRTGPGTVQIDLNGESDVPLSVTTTSNGKIVVGAQTEYLAWGYPGAPGDESLGYEFDHAVLRLNANGSLDSKFHDGGVDVVPAPFPSDAYYDRTYVQADGKVLIATTAAASLKHTLRLERYNTDGTLDTAFGHSGVVVIDTPYNIEGFDLGLGADGAPYLSASGTNQATVVKLDKNGSLIDAIGDGGVLTLSASATDGEIFRATPTYQPDGDVLLGIWYVADSGSEMPAEQNTLAYKLERYNPDGSLDLAFGENGTAFLGDGEDLTVSEVAAVQADGKIITLARDLTSGFLARFNTDGSLDGTFGDGGKVTLEMGWPNELRVQADGKILAIGNPDGDIHIARLNADGSLDTRFGSSDGKLHIDGYLGEEILRGTDAAEVIRGLAGNDVLLGNGGKDVLQGGAGADIFRFTQISDSYRTTSQTNSDRILDFDAYADRIDLTKLGFTSIGDGRNGTLSVQVSADGSKTYLKSYEVDSSGKRFELALDGNFSEELNSTNVVFSAPTIQGTPGKDTITGSALPETIYGLAGNDKINGGAGADVIIGGAGADQLNGGDRIDIELHTYPKEDADVFLYTSTDDSYSTATQSFSDLIVNFETHYDKIDVSALGYTGFGDGTGTTLKVTYSSALDRTYLKDLEADSKGHKFQIALTGDWLSEIEEKNMVFAPQAEVGLVGVALENGETHLAG